MNGSDLDRRLSGFFDTASSEALPGGLLDDVYAVTRRLPQRRGPAARQTTGPLQDPRIELTRPNMTGEVSIDGFPSN